MRVMGLDHLIGNKEYDTLEVLNETGNNVQMIRWMEEAFEKQDFAYWEKAFKENDIPFQKCFTMDDILNDQEAYDNDILRKIPYDSLGGSQRAHQPHPPEKRGGSCPCKIQTHWGGYQEGDGGIRLQPGGDHMPGAGRRCQML